MGLHIDSSRDVVLVGHYRSGSSWFQSCLPQFNCKAAFHTPGRTVLSADLETNTIHFKRLPWTLDLEIRKNRIIESIKIIDSILIPKSVKIQVNQFHETSLEWAKNQDAQFIWIERKDKIKAFRSMLIADTLDIWEGVIPVNSLKINLTKVKRAYETIFIRGPYDQIRTELNKEFQEVFYEDLLVDHTFDKSKSKVIHQNSSNIEIENVNEINQILEKLGSDVFLT